MKTETVYRRIVKVVWGLSRKDNVLKIVNYKRLRTIVGKGYRDYSKDHHFLSYKPLWYNFVINRNLG